jgi:hypothetical protein
LVFIVLVILGAESSASDDVKFKSFHFIRAKELSKIQVHEYLLLLSSSKKGWVTISEEINNWPSDKEVQYPLSRLEDDSACMSVTREESSYLDNGHSKISDQAKYILLGMKEKKYPPRLNSSSATKEELTQAVSWAKENF